MATATVVQIPEGYVPPTFEPPAPGAAVAAPSLATKLYRIMGDIEAVPKIGHNKDQNYDYVRASEISKAVGKLLAKHRVSLTWEFDTTVSWEWRTTKTSSNKDWREVTIWFFAIFEDGDTREKKIIRWPGVGADGGDKAVAKAITAAGKSFLTIQFQIPDNTTEPDKDGAEDNRGGNRNQQQRDQRCGAHPEPHRDRGRLIGIDPRPPHGTAITIKFHDNTQSQFWIRTVEMELMLAGTLNKLLTFEWDVKTQPAKGDKPETKFNEIIRIILVDGKPPQSTAPGSSGKPSPQQAPTEVPKGQPQPIAQPTAPTSHFPPSNEGAKQEVNLDAEPPEQTGMEKTFAEPPQRTSALGGSEPPKSTLFDKGNRSY
jgi:hypothetical protein